MPVTYDVIANEIWLDGKVIGNLTMDGNEYRLRMNIDCSFKDADKRAELLVALSTVIDRFEDKGQDFFFSWECSNDDLELVKSELQLLEEATISIKGLKWRFHKNDADHWPSPLHGHEVNGRKVVDGLTGEVFDKSTRKMLGKLNKKALSRLHEALKKNKDIGPLAQKLIE